MSESLTRKSKLLRLREYINLETGVIDEGAFLSSHVLYERAKEKKALDSAIRRCRKCPGLNMPWVTEAAPGWGSLTARIFFIGQSLHEPGVETSIPFILGSGLLIDAALALSSIGRHDIFWTNAVHCHPLKNRPSTDGERRNCLPYLREELLLIEPDFIVAFGNDARASLEKALLHSSAKKFTPKTLFLKHPAALYRTGSPEARVAWILRLAKALDKYSGEQT